MASIPATHLTEAVVQAGFIHSKDFGPDFLFGSSTSACQIEGGREEDGRRPSIFDTFADNRDLYDPYGPDAVNHRKYYKEDVELMKQIGFNAYRFSISWSRVMPTGKKESRNQPGINFYKNLIAELKKKNITPVATLVHFDPPQDLEDSYYTFLSDEIVDDFCDYAELCFQEFGHDVKYWITVNEPWSVAYAGYVTGDLAPGYGNRKKYEAENSAGYKFADHQIGAYSSICPPLRSSIKSASSSSFQPPVAPQNAPSQLPDRNRWPYIVAHNQILAHAKAARLYKDVYQKCQHGQIGFSVVSEWFVPLVDNEENRDAKQRALDFMLGWFMDPLFRGDYPISMYDNVTKGYLPDFGADKEIVRGSYDFIALNYYTTRYVTNEDTEGGDYVLDRRVRFYDKNLDDELIGDVTGAGGWVHGYPSGLSELLKYIKKNYGDPEIYIAENGFDDGDDDSMTRWDSFHDRKRTLYLHDHLSYLRKAIRDDHVKVKGHFVWSFLDNMELGSGYKYRFGIVYVDYRDKEKSKRIPKSTVSWYRYFFDEKQILKIED